MGVVGLFMLAVKCFHILAWPLLALVYPLWASIREIEADDSSTSECKKLVAYWVLFSLIFLFEQAFDKLLLWLTFWLYMKLIITCWLVIPNFDGALYVYKHLVSPCLSMDIKALISKFIAWMDFYLKRSNFEDELKRYVKENGPEALEQLIASQLKCREPNVVVKNDVKTVQVTEQIKDVAASEQEKFVPPFLQEVSLTGHDIAQTENKKPETDQISSEKVETVGESSEIQVPKQVQKEWTCATCQVTTYCETALKLLNSHLQGKRHKTVCGQLKTKTLQSENKASTVPEIKLKCRELNIVVKNDVKTVQVTEQIKEVAASEQEKFVPHFLQEVSLMGHGITQTENKKPETDQISSENLETVGESSEIPVPKQVQKEWTCATCHTTYCETALKLLDSHLQGKRHKTVCGQLKTKTLQSENKASTVPEIKKLKDWKDVSSKKNNLEEEIKNNGLEACEEPVSSKASLVEIDKNNLAAEEIKDISGEVQEVQVSNEVQKEWICTLCQVTTQSEITFNSHLQGRQHQAAFDELKTAFKELKTAFKELKTACKELETKNQQSENDAFTAPEIKEEDDSATKTEGKQTVETNCVEFRDKRWWCNICNISCTCMVNMETHLNAKKHLSKIRLLDGGHA